MKFVLVAGLLLVSTPSHAISCKIVRYYVAKYGQQAAEDYARHVRKATDHDIAMARRCLK